VVFTSYSALMNVYLAPSCVMALCIGTYWILTWDVVQDTKSAAGYFCRIHCFYGLIPIRSSIIMVSSLAGGAAPRRS